jgi:hypothetical protein
MCARDSFDIPDDTRAETRCKGPHAVVTQPILLPSLIRAVALTLIASCALAKPWDGPYVGHDAANQWSALWIDADGEQLLPRSSKVRLGDEIEVPAIGARPAFKVQLRDSAQPAPDAIPGATPMFVVADTHGEFEIATELLIRQRIMDEKLSWSFGRGQLVFLGDVFDRGPNHTELLWLIYKLEAEAARAGGAVHLVLGNHETMVLLGDERYLHPKYQQSTRTLNAPSYAALWGENSILGQWLRTKASVMKIGDYLCAHGGLGRELVTRKLTLNIINSTVRDALQSRHALPQPLAENLTFIMGPDGPLWYRGYFDKTGSGSSQATGADVTAVLKHFNARRILVGHTRVPTISPLYDGKVIAVQVYPHLDKHTGASVMESLLIRDGQLFRALANGELEKLEATSN